LELKASKAAPSPLQYSFLPTQVAAYADTHILVRKSVDNERTETTFTSLEDTGSRVAEVAAMLDLEMPVAQRLVEQARFDVTQSAAMAAAAIEVDVSATGPSGSRPQEHGVEGDAGEAVFSGVQVPGEARLPQEESRAHRKVFGEKEGGDNSLDGEDVDVFACVPEPWAGRKKPWD
jgi:hypothetical protein